MASGFNFDDDALFKEFDLGSDFGEPELGEGVAKKTARAALDILKESTGPMMQTVKHQLSNELYEASDLFDEGLEVVSDFKRLKDDLAKEIVPAFNTLKIVTRRVLPKAKAFIPKGLYGKTEDYLNRTITTPTREKSAEERQAEYNNATVADSLNMIFARQQQRASAEALQHATERTVDQHLDSARFKTVNRGLSLITGGIGGVGSFLQGTFTDYLKKDIELKYRHLFIAKDTYNAIKLTLGVVDRKLEEIKHNTGMPDSLKASDPRYRKGKNEAQSYNDYLYNFRKTLMGNIHTNIMDSVKMVTQLGIPMLDTMTQMGGMGLTIPQLIGKGIGWIGSKYVKGKVNQFIDNNQSSFDLLRGFTENIKDRLTMRISNWANRTRSSDNPFMYWLASMVPEIVGDTRVKNDLMTSPDAAATFDVATRQSIVEIIPAHLAFIGKHIRGLAEAIVPGAKFADIYYNPAKREITSSRQAGVDLIYSKIPYAKDIKRTNEDTMNAVRRATLQAHKVASDSERGKELLSNTNNMQDDLLKFFINSGVRRRFLDIELLSSYLNDPFHMENDYITDVLDGIDEPVNFVASLLSTITDPESGKIDQMALVTIENAILSYTKKIDISRVAPIISNTYGASKLLRDQGLIGDDGNLSMEGVRKFYGQVNGPEKEFYVGGNKLSSAEAKEKGYTAGNWNYDYALSKDVDIENKRKALLKELVSKGTDDPRIEMLQSGNPVLVATALAMGDSDSFLNKTLMSVGSVGKWVYDKGKTATDWVMDKVSGGYSTFEKWEDNLGFGPESADEKLKLKSVERLNANRFKCTASSDTRTKTAELHTKHGYGSGKFPDKGVLKSFCSKQKWVLEDYDSILFIDNKVEETFYDDKSYIVTSESVNAVQSGSLINVIPTYLQYILEAIYIANGKKKLIPKVNLGRGFGFGGTPAMATAGGPSGPIPSGGAYGPVGSVGANSFFVVPQGTVDHYTSGDVVDNFKDLADEVKSTVNDDAHGYFDKLDMYLPSKEGFLSKFTIPEDRQKMDDFWESTVKKNITFKRFLDAFCEELHGSAKVKDGLIMIHRYARSLTDPNEREQYVGDELARAYMVCKNITDPNERESLWDRLRHKAGEKFEELKNSNKKPEEGKGLFGIRDAIKKGWNKFRETRLYKYLSSKIPPEVKERIKKEFFKAKEGVKEGWDKAMDELSKWADPEAYKKRRLQEASEKKFMEERVDLPEDGETDPYLLEMINEAQSEAPKEKKLSWWQRTKARFREARRVYKEEKAEAKRQRAEEREYERKMREADELIRERQERSSIWKEIKDDLKGIFGISKRKEEKEKKEEKEESLASSHGKVNRAAKAALSDVGFIGPGNNDAFHSDFLTFASASLKLLDAIRVNAGIGIMSTISTLISSGAGIVGNVAKGAGLLYGGLLRGAGSAFGGIARGVGSIAGGILKSGLPSAVIKAGGSIIGGGLHGWGHAIGGTATGLGYAAGGAANLGKGILGTLFGTGSTLSGAVMNMGRRLTRPRYIDIYLKDKIIPGKPLLSAKKQEEGVFFADGSLVKNSMDIKAPVFEMVDGDPNPRTLITEEDIKQGLVDAKGVPLVENTAVFRGQFSGFAGLVANGLGIAALGIGSLFNKLAEFAGITIKKGGEITATILSRLFGIDTEGTQKYQKQMLSNFKLLLDILQSSYFVSYTRKEHDVDEKERKRREEYEKRLDAEEQRRDRNKGTDAAFGGATAAGTVGGQGSGSGDASGEGAGNGDDSIVDEILGYTAGEAVTVAGRKAYEKFRGSPLKQNQRVMRDARKAATKATNKANAAKKEALEAYRKYQKTKSPKDLAKAKKLLRKSKDASQAAVKSARQAKAAYNAAKQARHGVKPAAQTLSKIAKLKRAGKWGLLLAGGAAVSYGAYSMFSGGDETDPLKLTPEQNAQLEKHQSASDDLYERISTAELPDDVKARLRNQVQYADTLLDPKEYATEYKRIETMLYAENVKAHGKTYADQYRSMHASANDANMTAILGTTSLTPDLNDKSEGTGNYNSYTVDTKDVGKTVNLADGSKVTLTDENISKFIGAEAYDSDVRQSFIDAGNVASTTTDVAMLGSMGMGALAHVPKIAGTAGGNFLGAASKTVGKVAAPLMLAQAAYGAVDGVTMDEQQRKKFFAERQKGAFGDGRLTDWSNGSWENLSDQYSKGFWKGTGTLGKMALNEVVGAFDFVEHGRTIGSTLRETGGLISDLWDMAVRPNSNKVKTKDENGKEVVISRSDLMLKGKLKTLDKYQVKERYGQALYALLKKKYTIAYKEQGAPDMDWGRSCAYACDRAVMRSFVADPSKLEPAYVLQGLTDCEVGLKNGQPNYVYVYKGSEKILADAKENITKFLERVKNKGKEQAVADGNTKAVEASKPIVQDTTKLNAKDAIDNVLKNTKQTSDKEPKGNLDVETFVEYRLKLKSGTLFKELNNGFKIEHGVLVPSSKETREQYHQRYTELLGRYANVIRMFERYKTTKTSDHPMYRFSDEAINKIKESCPTSYLSEIGGRHYGQFADFDGFKESSSDANVPKITQPELPKAPENRPDPKVMKEIISKRSSLPEPPKAPVDIKTVRASVKDKVFGVGEYQLTFNEILKRHREMLDHAKRDPHAPTDMTTTVIDEMFEEKFSNWHELPSTTRHEAVERTRILYTAAVTGNLNTDGKRVRVTNKLINDNVLKLTGSSQPELPKAQVTTTTSQSNDERRGIDLSNPVKVEDSSVVRSSITRKTETITKTQEEKESTQAIIDRLTKSNDVMIGRLDLLAKLMGMNIKAVNNAGDMTRTQVNDGLENAVDTSLRFTKGAVEPLIPKYGPLRSKVPAINVGKKQIVPAT